MKTKNDFAFKRIKKEQQKEQTRGTAKKTTTTKIENMKSEKNFRRHPEIYLANKEDRKWTLFRSKPPFALRSRTEKNTEKLAIESFIFP